ncbi:hypothetical protein FNV64_47355 [Streptomyces sp. S1A1-7]|nr:hypothetical protein FNV64_47355 [Streptomyces sp. S1A1-7]
MKSRAARQPGDATRPVRQEALSPLHAPAPAQPGRPGHPGRGIPGSGPRPAGATGRPPWRGARRPGQDQPVGSPPPGPYGRWCSRRLPRCRDRQVRPVRRVQRMAARRPEGLLMSGCCWAAGRGPRPRAP